MSIINTKIQHTNELFSGGRSCAQSMLMSWAEDHGMRIGDAFRIAAGFGGGMAISCNKSEDTLPTTGGEDS
jgi:hypothetical protein